MEAVQQDGDDDDDVHGAATFPASSQAGATSLPSAHLTARQHPSSINSRLPVTPALHQLSPASAGRSQLEHRESVVFDNDSQVLASSPSSQQLSELPAYSSKRQRVYSSAAPHSARLHSPEGSAASQGHPHTSVHLCQAAHNTSQEGIVEEVHFYGICNHISCHILESPTSWMQSIHLCLAFVSQAECKQILWKHLLTPVFAACRSAAIMPATSQTQMQRLCMTFAASPSMHALCSGCLSDIYCMQLQARSGQQYDEEAQQSVHNDPAVSYSQDNASPSVSLDTAPAAIQYVPLPAVVSHGTSAHTAGDHSHDHSHANQQHATASNDGSPTGNSLQSQQNAAASIQATGHAEDTPASDAETDLSAIGPVRVRHATGQTICLISKFNQSIIHCHRDLAGLHIHNVSVQSMLKHGSTSQVLS